MINTTPTVTASYRLVSLVLLLFALLAPTSTLLAQTGSHFKLSNLTGVAAERALNEGIPICHSFDCSVRDIVSITETEWDQVIGWFNPAPASADEERQRVQHAIGWLEVVVSRYVPTQSDVAGNLPPGGTKEGQLDCIDESHNTTTYLRLLEKAGVLRFHTVVERAYRRAIFDQHWSGQIEQIDSKERFVVDSWFQDNGYLPHVEPASEWKDLSFFSSAYLPSRARRQRRKE